MSGSFTPGEVGGISSKEGGMSIALSSPDGRVVGGLLAGILTAAGPVQVSLIFKVKQEDYSRRVIIKMGLGQNILLGTWVDPLSFYAKFY